MGNERGERYRRIVSDFIRRDLERSGEEIVWENKMMTTMKQNSKNGAADFSFRIHGSKTTFTQNRDGQKESITIKKISSGVQVGSQNEPSWDGVEVKKEEYDRCGWFRQALEENMVRVYVLKENKQRKRGALLNSMT